MIRCSDVLLLMKRNHMKTLRNNRDDKFETGKHIKREITCFNKDEGTYHFVHQTILMRKALKHKSRHI